MQRVVSINLDGNVYQLEENGLQHPVCLPRRDGNAAQRQSRIACRRWPISSGPSRTSARRASNLTRRVVTSGEIDRIISNSAPVPASRARPPASSSAPRAPRRSSGASSSSSARPGRQRLDDNARSDEPTASPPLPDSRRRDDQRRLYRARDFLQHRRHHHPNPVRDVRRSTGGWGILAYVVLMVILPNATRAPRPQAMSRPREQTAAAIVAVGRRWLAVGPPGWPWDRPARDRDPRGPAARNRRGATSAGARWRAHPWGPWARSA